ncbi:Calcium/calmodulin-dependent protein kinase type 1 [Conglomerata obtusa]
MVKNIIRSLLEAVKYLQQFGIIHTKIMPSSIMCYKDSENKLCFKLSCLHDAIILVRNGCDPKNHSETCQKDPNEMICEYFKFEDKWDIGYTALVLYTGIDVPYDQLNSNGEHVLLSNNTRAYLIKHKIFGKFYRFLLKCLLFSSSRKISAESLLQDRYFN